MKCKTESAGKSRRKTEIRNFGICGAPSTAILEKELPEVEKFRPTLSIVLAGTNDAGNVNSLQAPALFRDSYRSILAGLNRMGSRVIVLTIPPLIDRAFEAQFGKEPFQGFMPNERLEIENRIVMEEAARAGAAVVDINSVFSRTDLESVYGYIRHRRNYKGEDDGCHPTHDGYRIIARMIYDKIREIGADTSRIACIGDSITYGAYMQGHGTAEIGAANYPGLLHLLLEPNAGQARKRKPFVKKSIIYQLSLRAFTKEGTLAAAEKHLEEIKELTAADIIYLLPIAKADPDSNEEFWSERQKASGCGNPRNPYRIADYNAIDPEYGTEKDLASFVEKAHSLGLKVILDLVYFHAGPSFAKKHPAFVKRSGDGSVVNGQWSFPELEFSNRRLREHLWENMEYFVREFDIDGYRCDVGDRVPLDFWEEGRRRIEKLNKNVIMLNEAELARPDDQKYAFDLNYSFSMGMLQPVLTGDLGCSDLECQLLHNEAAALRGARFIRCFENHDIANDMYGRRFERLYGEFAVNALLAFCYTIGGTPFLYNGCEFRDGSRHSIFANKGEFVIDRGADNSGRVKLLLRLAELFRSEEALFEGATKFVRTNYPREVIAYIRESASGEKIFVAVNLSLRNIRVKPESIALPGDDPLLAEGASVIGGEIDFSQYGFLITRLPAE